ncbi:Hypothetical predicted protein [Mytilus galloprovincialis]|uniref:Ig-like domain-containing protein n=1 Tax=Mytilus galloprovincialis TaxID=29158 RepID=A0A8B6GHD4_MYTGA|nr:Hypothetical predicted protein [Mytilus galloprovincialis]
MRIIWLAFWIRTQLVMCGIDKPSIKIHVSNSFIKEGETMHLDCTTRSNPKATSISWCKDNKKLRLTTSKSSLRLTMSKVSRYDSGKYRCSAQNEIGNTSSEISIVISYPPVVNVCILKLYEDSTFREIQCIPLGEPDSYNYFPWEHRSRFNEHIRYLGATDDGKLQIPVVNVSNRYQNSGFYICNVSNGIPDNHGNVFQQGRTYVEFADKPSIKIHVSNSFIKEGETMHLDCTTRSNPKATSISWYQDNKKLRLTTSKSSLRLTMSKVSRYDSGKYRCSAQNEIGNTSSEISIVISYPPVVNVCILKLYEDSTFREIQCIPLGEPDSYNYFPWEHRSRFNEHIRYLGATDNGKLQIPVVNVSNRYQNSGFYICNVSNGIPDNHGNVFQQGRTYVEFAGPPVFAANTKRFQKVTTESSIKLTVNVYSSSKITCHDITEVDGTPLPKEIGVTTRPVLIKETFHDTNVTLNGTEIVFVLNGLNAVEFHSFNITMCNNYGRSSFVINSKHLAKPSEEKALSSQRIIIIVLLIIVLVLVTGIGVYVRYTKRRHRKKMITAISIQTAERTVDETPHYAEIIEEDMILTLPQEPEILVAENSNTTGLSEEHSSSSSNTDNNASEDLNDGYEKPYSTLVSNNGHEVEHDYHKTKQNWIYENSTTCNHAIFDGFPLD